MQRRLLFPLIFIMVVAFGGLALVTATGTTPELGLDLQGGVSVVLQPTHKADSGQLDVALEVIRNRVDALGVAEPEIVRQGGNIVVQLPGVHNRDRALALVGQTAELRFRPVMSQEIPVDQVDAARKAASTTTTAPGETTTTTAASSGTTEGAIGMMEGESAAVFQEPTTTTTAPPPTTTTAPSGEPSDPFAVTKREDDKADASVVLEDKDKKNLYQLGPTPKGSDGTLLTGRVIQSAQAELNPQGQWEVALSMHGGANGIDLFNEIAAQCNPPSQTCP